MDGIRVKCLTYGMYIKYTLSIFIIVSLSTERYNLYLHRQRDW
jgi:hypothetical protein